LVQRAPSNYSQDNLKLLLGGLLIICSQDSLLATHGT
jgi:hypothetical protein